jgi:hypothetical protein
MPMLELTDTELIVHLNLWEKAASLQRSIRIPIEHVRGATEDEGFRGPALGLRAPGTGFPGLISAGHYRKGGDRQFVFVTRGRHPVVIELANEKWARIVLGVADARLTAATINAALARRHAPLRS